MMAGEQRTASGYVIEGVTRPSLSIVIEWENVRLAGDDRALRMMRSLASQIENLLARPNVNAEVLVVVDLADEVEDIETGMREFFPVYNRSLSLRRGRPGAKYYEKKNVGAAAACGAIIILLDSDVIPEEGGWSAFTTRLTTQTSTSSPARPIWITTEFTHHPWQRSGFSRSGIRAMSWRLPKRCSQIILPFDVKYCLPTRFQ